MPVHEWTRVTAGTFLVGCTLPDTPLFLTPDHYIYVSLEDTYMAPWRGVPQRWRRVIAPQSDGSQT